MPPIPLPLNLVQGWDPNATPRDLQPLWRDMLNFRMHDGYACKRQTLSQIASAILPDLTTVDPDSTPQTPLLIFNNYIGDAAGHIAVITNREAWKYDTGTWYNITPTYTVGTIDCTSGTPNVTVNTGTPLWQTRGIVVGQLIELDSSWYTIQAVTDTTITLTTNYSGTTLIGAAYTIRRRWIVPNTKAHVYGVEFNGDLYAAGYIGGGTNVTVIKFEDIWKASVATPGTYLTSTTDLTGTLDVLPSPAGIHAINGIVILDDGRVVIAAVNLSGRTARVYYSALQQDVWSVRPGGFTDVTTKAGPMRALTRFGTGAVLHYDGGIAIGQPTGQRSPPLVFHASQADHGAFLGHTIVPNLPYGQQGYLGSDGLLYLWNGSQSVPLASQLRNDLGEIRRIDLLDAYSSWDAYRQEWSIWIPEDTRTRRYVITMDERSPMYRQVVKQQYAANVAAVSRYFWNPPKAGTAQSGKRSEGVALVGIPSKDPTSSTTADMLLVLLEDGNADYATGYDNATDGGFFLESCDIDGAALGNHESMLLLVDYLALWARSSSPGSETVTVKVSYDAGVTYETLSPSLALLAGEKMFYYKSWLKGPASEALRFRIEFPSSAAAAELSRIKLWLAPSGASETILS